MIGVTLATFVFTVILFRDIPKGFFPVEDNGLITVSTLGPDDASFDAMVSRQTELANAISRDPDVISINSTVGGGNAANTQNSGRMFITLRAKPERKASANEVIQRLRRVTGQIPGIQAFFQPIQSITIGAVQTRSQYQYTLQSPDLEALRHYATILEAKVRDLPGILDVNSDLQMKARSTIVDGGLLYAFAGSCPLSSWIAAITASVACRRARPEEASP